MTKNRTAGLGRAGSPTTSTRVRPRRHCQVSFHSVPSAIDWRLWVDTGCRSNLTSPYIEWLLCPKPIHDVQLRLFCFPYAGGGASIFNSWAELLPPKVELWSLQLPGRETQRLRPPFTRMEPLVETLSEVLRPHLDVPFAFYGHSMGALVSFEVARSLRRRERSLPACLFVSGHRAPQLPAPHKPIHNLPDAEFLSGLQTWGGTPDDVISNPELMQLFLPLLRADFELCETYVYSDEEPLDCKISCFGGIDDRRVNRQELLAWRVQSRTPFKLRFLPGGHFFLHGSVVPLLHALGDDLKEILRRLGRRVYKNVQ